MALERFSPSPRNDSQTGFHHTIDASLGLLLHMLRELDLVSTGNHTFLQLVLCTIKYKNIVSFLILKNLDFSSLLLRSRD